MIATGSLRQKLLDLAVSGKLVPRTGEWRTVPLEEIANVQLGKMLDKAKNTGKPFRYLANINVRWREFDLSDLKETLFDEKDIGKFSLSKGDLLMCEGGEPGRCAVWEEVDSDIKYQKAIHRIRCSACVSPYFLQIYFEAIAGKAFFTQRFTGSTIHHLPREVLLSTPIPLPPLEEQKRIVARLEELLALEREIAADGAALDDLVAAARRKILDLAVSGKLVPRQGEWKRVKGKDLFADTESRLPEGDFFDYIDIDAIDNKAHRVVSPKHLKVSDAPSRATRGVRTGDTIFSIVRPYLENIAYIDESLSHCIASTGFHVCRPRDFCDNKYLFMLMTSPYVIQGLNAFMKGDNSPSIRKNDIMNFAFPIPPLAEQKAIVKRVDELMALLDAMKG